MTKSISPDIENSGSTSHQSHKSNAELLSLLLKKDPMGLRLLYKKYAASLFGIVNRIIPEPLLAEKVMEEVFTIAWQQVGHFKGQPKHLYAWLARIARDSSVTASGNSGNSEANNNPTRELSFSSNGHDNRLNGVIKKMDKKCRRIINQSFLKGNSHAQIAKQHAIPTAKVRQRVRYAIKQFRSILKE